MRIVYAQCGLHWVVRMSRRAVPCFVVFYRLDGRDLGSTAIAGFDDSTFISFAPKLVSHIHKIINLPR